MSQHDETPTIQTRQKSTEVQLRKLLDDVNSAITVETVKQAIFHARNNDLRPFVLDMVAALGHRDIDSLDDTAIQVIQDAWNYFPHGALGGSCPAALVFATATGRKKSKRRNSAAGG